MNKWLGARDRGLARIFLVISVFGLFCSFRIPHSAFAIEKWPGVDETVVEKIAKEHGREAREPFINSDQGDLLLFVFLLAGSVGGFAAGYCWRMLVSESGFTGLKDGQDYRLKSSKSPNPVNLDQDGQD